MSGATPAPAAPAAGHGGGGHGEEGGAAIIAALLANLGIAAAKFVAFVFTGSSSLLAEAVHSLADTGNQGLLLFGRRRAERPADERHPFGYGADRYFYAFVVALVLFTLGSLFALYEGVQKLRHPHHLDDPAIALIVLVVAIGLESFSLRTAYKEASPLRGGLPWLTFLRRSKSPDLPVVLLEDTAALTGLAFALVGVGLAVITGNGRWDGVGSLAIGLLLGVVAVFLAGETKSLLIGEGADPAALTAIRGALADGDRITRVIHLRTLHLAPDELLVAAKVALAPGLQLPAVAEAIDAAEARVRAAEPTVTLMYLEPDLYRPQQDVTGPDPGHGRGNLEPEPS